MVQMNIFWYFILPNVRLYTRPAVMIDKYILEDYYISEDKYIASSNFI